MTVNIYDTANQLEREIRETEQFKNLKNSFEAIQNDKEANEIFNEFRQIQRSLQTKQMSGQNITEEEAQQAQELSTKVSNSELITQLLEAEKAIGQMIDDVNQVVLKPVRELYE